MKTKSGIAVAPFLRESAREPRCILCSDKEVSEWLSSCLLETKKVGAPKPSASRIHREVRKAFPGRQPRAESSTRHHLREHEPEWDKWGDED